MAMAALATKWLRPSQALAFLTHEAQIGFVYQSSRLESMVGPLTIEQCNQIGFGVGIAVLEGGEQLSNFAGSRQYASPLRNGAIVPKRTLPAKGL
jgi:hypothetical protein